MVSDEYALRRLESDGCLAKVISVDHLEELRDDIVTLHQHGSVDDALYQERLSQFRFETPKELPDARAIVVCAVPQPMYALRFNHAGVKVPVVLPPTYADGEEIDADAISKLAKATGTDGSRFAPAVLPKKTLATRSGLAQYGRNNITYVRKYGSFHRLAAFFTDYRFDCDQWQERETLPTCAKCSACIEACPTKAILEERFLIRAERCLCYLNEKSSDHAFPDWVKPEWHNAIIGCMECQKVCPHNSSVSGWIEDREEFDGRDTEYLLSGGFEGERAKAMDLRLRRLGMDLTIFPRNLRVLLR